MAQNRLMGEEEMQEMKRGGKIRKRKALKKRAPKRKAQQGAKRGFINKSNIATHPATPFFGYKLPFPVFQSQMPSPASMESTAKLDLILAEAKRDRQAFDEERKIWEENRDRQQPSGRAAIEPDYKDLEEKLDKQYAEQQKFQREFNVLNAQAKQFMDKEKKIQEEEKAKNREYQRAYRAKQKVMDTGEESSVTGSAAAQGKGSVEPHPQGAPVDTTPVKKNRGRKPKIPYTPSNPAATMAD